MKEQSAGIYVCVCARLYPCLDQNMLWLDITVTQLPGRKAGFPAAFSAWRHVAFWASRSYFPCLRHDLRLGKHKLARAFFQGPWMTYFESLTRNTPRCHDVDPYHTCPGFPKALKRRQTDAGLAGIRSPKLQRLAQAHKIWNAEACLSPCSPWRSGSTFRNATKTY